MLTAFSEKHALRNEKTSYTAVNWCHRSNVRYVPKIFSNA